MPRRQKTSNPSEEAAWIDRVKRRIVVAIFSDEMMMQRFVLKGGNAIDLILHVSSRASMDIDLSMEGDFASGELEEIRRRLHLRLIESFAPEGLRPFDLDLREKPAVVTADLAAFWGGYRATFKLIQSDRFNSLSGKIADLRRNAILVAGSSKLQIDVSKYEYCEPKEERQLDGVNVIVYTPVMLACEKLRAICQQTKEYSGIVKRKGRPAAPRARDFVDINILMRHFGFDLADRQHWALIEAVFGAKKVPLKLLDEVKNYREFHRTDFQAVIDSLKPGAKLDEFDDYFDDVVGLCERLKALWNA